MNKEARIKKIAADIKSVKIQGATNIAKAAAFAYSLSPTQKTKKLLLSLRPTEPTLTNTLNHLAVLPKDQVLAHFQFAQEEINRQVLKLIKPNSIIFTHCHSTNVSKALIYAKRKGKNFQVYNTETRPLFQGRITAQELSKSGIKVTTFIDSATHEAIKKCNLILLGADAILKSEVINKIGSDLIAEIAFMHKVPLFIVADSWKFSPKNVKIEERDFHEVWSNAPKNVKIKNPAFEKIIPKYIKAIISEQGIQAYSAFIKEASKDLHKFLSRSLQK